MANTVKMRLVLDVELALNMEPIEVAREALLDVGYQFGNAKIMLRGLGLVAKSYQVVTLPDGPQDMAPSEPTAIVTGNVIDGFKFTGPFDGLYAAVNYAERKKFGLNEYVFARLNPPEKP